MLTEPHTHARMKRTDPTRDEVARLAQLLHEEEHAALKRYGTCPSISVGSNSGIGRGVAVRVKWAYSGGLHEYGMFYGKSERKTVRAMIRHTVDYYMGAAKQGGWL